jgi:secretion/DNA translocation related CpaE-like protein
VPDRPLPDRPLLVTGDADLLDHLVRLAAAAGVETEVAQDVGAARRAWSTAPVVLVGADLVGAVARAGLPRRASVLVADWSREDSGVWQAAAAAGAEAVHPLPGADDLLVRRLAGSRRPSTGRVLAVAGGRGGAGASTLACALARTAARSAPTTLLVDADPLGGGLDLAMGAEAAAGLRWPHLVGAEGRTDPHELTAALPVVDGVSVLSWHRGDPTDLPPAAMESVLGAARTAHRLTVVDLPRALDPAARTAAAVADAVLLVVPAEIRATAAAGQVAARLTTCTADLRVVVRGPAPGGLTDVLVAAELGLPLAGWLAPEPGLAAALERGEPPGRSGRGPLARLAGDLVRSFGASGQVA